MSQGGIPVYDSAQRPVPLLGELIELIRYRDLLVQLISRNIKIRYKRSILGILWTLLNPLMMMFVLWGVFSEVFRFTVEYYGVYVLSGLVFWNFFAQTTSAAMSELVWGGALLNRIYVPRAVFAVTALGTGLVNLLLSVLPLVVIMLVAGMPLTASLLLLPVPIFLVSLFALGVALFLSTLALYFADVLDMYQIFLTLWMYLTPVIYPKDIMPERYRWIFSINPMYYLLEEFRVPIYSGWASGSGTVVIAGVSAFLVLILGWWFFTLKADELSYRV